MLVHAELDIVHPDTASSSFGTKRIGARSEDARDNLRPGTSQVIDSMRRFAPATSNNAVSLRIPTQPPGFQIQRFFLDVDVPAGGRELVLTYRPRWVLPTFGVAALGACSIVAMSATRVIRRQVLKRHG